MSTINGTDGNDNLTGTAGNDVLYGLAGDDSLLGGAGNDVDYGGDGNDTIIEYGDGNDLVYGGAGNDYIYSWNGVDTLYGGDGNDTISTTYGYTYIEGGTGNDSLIGWTGERNINTNWYSSIYNFNLGDGNDTIVDSGNGKITFGSGISKSNIKFFGVSGTNDILIAFTSSTDSILIKNQISGSYVATLQFADGTTYTAAQMASLKEGIYGTTGNDTIIGTSGNDVMYGLAGNDSLAGGAGNDVDYGGDGNDTIYEAGDGNDLIYGDNGDDFLSSWNGVDTLYGGAGNDTIMTYYGYNYYTGGTGNDSLIGWTGERNISTNWYSSIYNFNLGDGNDTVVDSGNGQIIFGSGISKSNIKFFGVSGTNDLLIAFTSSTDSILIKNQISGSYITTLQFADGTSYTAAQMASLTEGIYGTTGNDTILGTSGNDVLYGLAGDDSLLGGAGNDVDYGGDGNDTIVEYGDGNDLVYGGAGNDYIYSWNGVDTLYGGDGNDTISTTYGYTYIEGGTGNDSLIGWTGERNISTNWYSSIYNFNLGDGNDTIVDSGNGKITFGSGISSNDALFIRNNNDLIIEFSNSTDSITIKNWYALGVNQIQQFVFSDGSIIYNTQIPTIIGTSGDDTIETGWGSNDVIYGEDGNDYINSGFNSDIVYGGNGNDTITCYYGSEYFDGGAGNDYIIASQNNTTGSGATMIGGTGDDYLMSGYSDNTYIFNLGDGNDTIEGKETNRINFGEGISKSNIRFIENGNDILIKYGTSDSILLTNQLTNLLISRVNFADGTNYTASQILTMLELWGTNGNDSLTGINYNESLYGFAGDDTLDGGAGLDTLIGGLGNDTYIMDYTGDMIIENLNEGIDKVNSSIDYALGSNLENLTLTGTAAINAIGNELNNYIAGNSIANSITGGAGNDTLNGGADADTMIGGIGNDTYYVDNESDIITEEANEGTDKVYSSIDYELGNNFENLTLTGTTAINAIGNELNNYIIGNSSANVLTGLAGNDTLDGGVGADTMIGGTGDDTYYVNNIGDVVTENANDDTDTVNSSITYTLGNNLENLTLTSTTTINATGNDLDNYIKGNSAANMLDGGIGADTMIGGTGNDTYHVDNAGDNVVETSALVTEIDTVNSSISYTLGNNVENLTLIGIENIDAIGNSLGNIITGNSGNNLLTGGLSNDTLIGGAGDDTYSFASGDGIDEINDSSGVDVIKFDSSVSKNDLYYLQNGDNLLIKNKTNSDEIIINGWYSSTGNHVESMLFSDATTITIDPTVRPISETINEDNALALDVLTDYNGQLVIDSITQGANGTVSIDANNQLVYIPNANYNGTDSYTYTLSDNNGGMITKTVNLTINFVNDAPTATLTSGTLNEDGSVILDVLTNVTDIDGDTLTISEYTQGTNGIITLNESNQLVYTPTANYNGTDSFNYTISDGNGGTITKTVNLNINAVNDAPTATLTSATLDEDSSVILDALASASDIESDALTISSYTQGTNGTITLNAENKLVYTPNTHYSGSDEFTYTVNDGNGGMITKTVLASIEPLPINITGASTDDVLTGNYKDNIIDGGVGADSLLGADGNDTYLFNSSSGVDTISDSAGNDTISLDSSINKDDIAVYMSGTDLVIDYGSTIGEDKVVILGQTNSATAVEKIQLSDGTFISNTNVNQLIQTMTSYASANSIQLTSVDVVKNNQELMTMVANSWHS